MCKFHLNNLLPAWLTRENAGFWGEVHAKTPGLYQVQIEFMAKKIEKNKGKGGLGGFWGRSTQKMVGLY